MADDTEGQQFEADVAYEQLSQQPRGDWGDVSVRLLDEGDGDDEGEDGNDGA